MSEPHVLIIGAGISGLLVAHGLQKAGIQYTIFETEEYGRFRSREWTMGIHWGLPLLESLLPSHLASRIATDGSVDSSLNYGEPPGNGACIYDGISGNFLKDLTLPGRMVRVSRRKLRALCNEGLNVRYGHTLQGVSCNDADNTVTATFANGENYTGNLVVGCDGPRSAVRSFLFSDEPAVAQAKAIDDITTMSMTVSYPAKTARYVRENAHPVWCICISPDIFTFVSTQDVPDPDKPETWRFFIFVSWLGEPDRSLDNAGRIKAMKDRGAKLAEVRCSRTRRREAFESNKNIW